VSTPVSTTARLVHWLRRLVLLPIVLYRRFVSPYTPPTCRFRPTCSAYAEEAILVHGLLRGSWLAVRRILRCHPFGPPPGLDPVPPPRQTSAAHHHGPCRHDSSDGPA
jgi:hypothetical protein